MKQPLPTYQKVAIGAAGGYWILIIVIFWALQFAGFDVIGHGGIFVAALTIPWSMLAIALGSSQGIPESVLHYIASVGGTFVVFCVGCSGLNAVLIYSCITAFALRKRRR